MVTVATETTVTTDLFKERERLVEQLKEWLWDNEQITDHIKKAVDSHLVEYHIKSGQPMNDLEEELYCQYQVVEMNRILALVMNA